MKYLKRKHARLVTVLMVVAITFVFLPVLAYDVMDAHSLVWAFMGVIGASVCVIGMLVAQILFLRCPDCGQGYARSYWKRGEGHEQFCRKCGKQFFFDDEIRPE